MDRHEVTYAHPSRVRKPGAPDEKDQQAREALEKASGQLPHLSPGRSSS
jgi:hypothetical protein